MSDETSGAPTAIPFYKSRVLRGLTTLLVTHLLAHLHLIDKFSSADIASFVNDGLDYLGDAAATYAFYARVAKPNPQLTLNSRNASAINEATTANPTTPASPAIPQPSETKA